ncbi:putative MFS-type transporter [Yarrowia sp. B02]|nr:putative MFS-type transporter [Yarrowia sp. B02]
MSITREPPGTVLLETSETIVLQPTPSSDPNDPLNWAKWRKYLNFFIICFFTLMDFTANDVPSVMRPPWRKEFGWSFAELNNTYAISLAGMGLGCPLLVPFANKFGRRPVYLVAAALVVAMVAWMSEMNTIGEAYGAMFILGLSGSVTETIIQMTVADMFFVHERGTFNGIYMLIVDFGNFIVLVPAGYCTVNLGWRWTYRIIAIISAVMFLMVALLMEETTYTRTVSVIDGISEESDDESVTKVVAEKSSMTKKEEKSEYDLQAKAGPLQFPEIDSEIQMNPLRKRLAPYTYTPGSFREFLRKMYTPFLTLVTYPIVTFSAVQYGCLLSFLSMASSTISNSFSVAPYNFSSAGIGNINIAPCIGMTLGCFYGGWFNDKTIIWLSKRNNGIYEPEFRLYSLVFANLTVTVGMFMFGISIAHNVHWMVPTVGFAIVAFGYGSCGAIIVTYLIDCYEKIVSDAFIGVVVIRNGMTMMILFCLSPWVKSIGLQNTFISGGCLSLISVLLTLPMIKYGKELRRRSESRYLKESSRG